MPALENVAEAALPLEKPSAPKYTAEELLPHIQQQVASVEYAAALKFLQRAFELETPADGLPTHWLERAAETKNAALAEAAGMALVEMATTGVPEDDTERVAELLPMGDASAPALFALANAFLCRAVELAPEHGWEKYVNLAQLRDGAAAVELLERGEALLRAQLAAAAPETDAAAWMRHRLAALLCALAETYMTELCMEADAETRCEGYVAAALALDDANPEALVTAASVRLSQCRHAEADDALQRALATVRRLDETDALFPSYAVRTSLVRLLLEVAAAQSPAPEALQRAADAAALTVQLCAESDADPEGLYLCGLAHWCAGGGLLWPADDDTIDAFLAHQVDAAAFEAHWRAAVEHLDELELAVAASAALGDISADAASELLQAGQHVSLRAQRALEHFETR